MSKHVHTRSTSTSRATEKRARSVGGDTSRGDEVVSGQTQRMPRGLRWFPVRRRPRGAERAQEDHRLPCDARCGARQLPKAIRTAADPALKLDHAEGCHAAEADSAPVKVQPQHAVSRGQATVWQPCTVTSHLQPAAGEEIFADSQRDQSPAKTRAREASRRRAREPHKAAGSSVRLVRR